MPNFTYTKGIPDSPNDPSEDQPIMKVNNDSNFDMWDIDHIGFKQNDGGTHRFVHLKQQTVNPALTATQAVLFEKIVGLNTELFYRYGSAPQNTFQITSNGAVSAANGYSSLIAPEANPLKIQWGTFSGAPASGSFSGGHATGTILFSSLNTPFTTALYTAICIPFSTNPGPVGTPNLAQDPGGSGSVTIDTKNSSKLQFRWVFNSNSADYKGFYWVAIGS